MRGLGEERKIEQMGRRGLEDEIDWEEKGRRGIRKNRRV
jgi:hypothetical protein